MSITTKLWKRESGVRGLPSNAQGYSFTSDDLIDRHYMDLANFEDIEIYRVPEGLFGYYPFSDGSMIIEQNDGNGCMIVKALPDKKVIADSRLSLEYSRENNIPITLMDVFFKDSKVVGIYGLFDAPGSIRLKKFPIKKIRKDFSGDLAELTKTLFNRSLQEEHSLDNRKTFKDVQAYLQNVSLPGTYRNSVGALLQI